MAEPLHRVVVEVALRDEPAAVGVDARGVDLELVVLGGHEDLLGQEVHHRVVASVVSEGQAAGAAADGPAHQLVAKADGQHRVARQQLPDQLHLGVQGGGVTRAVGEDHPVRLQRLDLRQ